MCVRCMHYLIKLYYGLYQVYISKGENINQSKFIISLYRIYMCVLGNISKSSVPVSLYLKRKYVTILKEITYFLFFKSLDMTRISL